MKLLQVYFVKFYFGVSATECRIAFKFACGYRLFGISRKRCKPLLRYFLQYYFINIPCIYDDLGMC